MDHQLGRIDLINWQGRRNRRLKSNVSAWTVVIVSCATLGAVSMAAQIASWLHWSGPMAAVPAGLVLFAVSAQLVAVVRAALMWLVG